MRAIIDFLQYNKVGSNSYIQSYDKRKSLISIYNANFDLRYTDIKRLV